MTLRIKDLGATFDPVTGYILVFFPDNFGANLCHNTWNMLNDIPSNIQVARRIPLENQRSRRINIKAASITTPIVTTPKYV